MAIDNRGLTDADIIGYVESLFNWGRWGWRVCTPPCCLGYARGRGRDRAGSGDRIDLVRSVR